MGHQRLHLRGPWRPRSQRWSTPEGPAVALSLTSAGLQRTPHRRGDLCFGSSSIRRCGSAELVHQTSFGGGSPRWTRLSTKIPLSSPSYAGLRESLGLDAFDIMDHWEPNLCAVGIASPRDHSVLVYVLLWRARGAVSSRTGIAPSPRAESFRTKSRGGTTIWTSRRWRVWFRHTLSRPSNMAMQRTRLSAGRSSLALDAS